MFKHAERRTERRLTCVGIIEVYRRAFAETRAVGTAIVLDISPSGAGLRLSQRLPLGARLRLKNAHVEVAAVVRHVRAVGEDYVTGVEFQEAFGWSPDMGWPRLIPEHETAGV